MNDSLDILKPELWAIKANIVKYREYGEDKEIRNGTRLFSGGAKVFIVAAFMGESINVIVVGRHRGSKKWIHTIIDINLLEKFKLNLIYSPKVHEIASNITENGAWVTTKKNDAESLLGVIPSWQS